MSVYKRKYQAYTGALTSKRTRLLVLIRYGFSEVWASKITAILLVVCMLPFLGSVLTIYLANNPLVRLMISGRGSMNLEIGSTYFVHIMAVHCVFSIALASWIAPRLIGFDMADNGLASILSHAISRRDYIVAKLIVLMGFLSVVTWIPLLLLFCLQSYYATNAWASQNWFLFGGLFLGSFLWILLLSLIGLATSAWVKWRMAAIGSIFAIYTVSGGLGELMRDILDSNWGGIISLQYLYTTWWEWLMRAGTFDTRHGARLAIPVVLLAIGVFCAICILALNSRVRAREVVRG